MAYIVFGSQQLMVKKQVKKCIADYFKDDTNYEVLHFDSSKITEDELLSECEQFSLCGDKKVIVVENSNFLTAERDASKFVYTDSLVKYLKNENPSTILIFSVIYSKKLDSRNKIYKIVDESGKIIICKDLTEKEWPQQVALYFKKKNLSISDEAIDTLKENLFPLATVLTPNIPEAEVLSGLKINNEEEMLTAAKYIGDHYHCAVLLKGGHQINDANDLLYKEGNYQWFKGKRINNNNTHGTGCTLSSAIASYLARGENLENAVKKAKDYISGALAAMLDLGQGQGPMDHGYVLDKKD